MHKPILTDLDLVYLPIETSEFAADPFPYFEFARKKHPWLAKSQFGLVITEYQAMKELLGLDRSLRTANDGIVAIMEAGNTAWGRATQENIFAQQGETHRRLRDAVAPIFTPRHANEIRPLIREVIDGLLDDWVPKGHFDFEEFASYFPITVISRLIGGPIEAIPRLRSTFEALGAAFAMDPCHVPALEAAHTVIEDFVRNLVTNRRSNPTQNDDKDILDLLIDAGVDGRLSDSEIVLLLIFMYEAGYDTSKNVLTLIMRQMIEHSDVYKRCAEDYDFCGKVVEEMLRFCSVSTSFRLATEDLPYRDVLLPRDTMIFFPVSVAGRDPGTFPDPDRFDPDRPMDPRHRHIAFGRGPHVCLGQHIARAQLQEGLHRIAQRICDPKLAGPYGWRPFPGIWGLKGLPITFTPL